jgi:hypothetical protein
MMPVMSTRVKKRVCLSIQIETAAAYTTRQGRTGVTRAKETAQAGEPDRDDQGLMMNIINQKPKAAMAQGAMMRIVTADFQATTR